MRPNYVSTSLSIVNVDQAGQFGMDVSVLGYSQHHWAVERAVNFTVEFDIEFLRAVLFYAI